MSLSIRQPSNLGNTTKLGKVLCIHALLPLEGDKGERRLKAKKTLSLTHYGLLVVQADSQESGQT